jgi:integrase
LADDWLATQYRRAAEAIDAQLLADHRSVGGVDLALRCFVTFLVEAEPDVVSVAGVSHRHIEDYKPWLACRPGRTSGRVTANTIAHRLGTLRMFFVRIDEWGWAEAPGRVPIVPGDLPRQDRPLPKALDDPAAAQFLRAAQAEPRHLTRVVCEVLLRTGLRVGEFINLTADAVVLIGAGHWLHVPVGKLHDDRYLPLHPHLVTLIDDYRQAYVRPDHPLLLPQGKRPSAGSAHRHPADQQGRGVRRAGPHPSAPTAAYPCHASDQPGHEPGSNRRLARSSQP